MPLDITSHGVLLQNPLVGAQFGLWLPSADIALAADVALEVESEAVKESSAVALGVTVALSVSGHKQLDASLDFTLTVAVEVVPKFKSIIYAEGAYEPYITVVGERT